ncbi:GAF domain-containing protein [Aliikangiella sp. IMCC44632]
MSEEKSAFYQLLNKQLAGLLTGERNFITNLSQFSGLINSQLDDINWVGFYLTQPDQDLLLGPYQGQVACVRIPLGKGVCGTSALKRESILVEDVDQFTGHIACDSRSRSELVCPIVVNNKLIGVLDIDSPSLSRFDQADLRGMEMLVETLILATDFD